MTFAGILAQVLHLALMLLAAVLLPGLLRLLRARLQGRHGPSLWQPARDWMRLLRKQPVLADHASPVSSAAPYLGFAAVLAAAALVPGFMHGMALAPMSDLVVLAGLLLLARAAEALASLDAGTAAGGRAAARAMGQDGFALPALLLATMGFAVLTGTTAPDAIGATLQEAALGPRLALALLLPALLAVALAGTGQLSSGSPVPEASGRHLALWEMQRALRLVLWVALLAGLFVPWHRLPGCRAGRLADGAAVLVRQAAAADGGSGPGRGQSGPAAGAPHGGTDGRRRPGGAAGRRLAVSFGGVA
ncbi:NADH-quinone oxidoreductase subunit H [Pseudoroseomonas wenyumeiae]